VKIEPALTEAVLDQVRTGHVALGEVGRGAVGRGAAATEARIETPYLQLVLTRPWQEEMKELSMVLRAQTLHRLGGAERIVGHEDRAHGGRPGQVRGAAVDPGRAGARAAGGIRCAHPAPGADSGRGVERAALRDLS
jgi:hypothetical protein